MNLTLRDVAKILNVSERTIYRWIDQETIPAYRINEQYRFNRAELLAWATARRIKVSDQLLLEPESRGAPTPSFGDTLTAGGIFYRLEGRDKTSVLRAAVDLVKLPDDVDRDWVFRMLLARESLASTGVGEGVAIPHARYPIALHTPQPSLTLFFLENSVDYGALDGQPVRTLFVLLSATVRGHLALLSQLGFALRDLGFKSAVLREGSREDILREARRVEKTLAATVAPAEAISGERRLL
jgi:PTS system nitrogen regulatory IIA component